LNRYDAFDHLTKRVLDPDGARGSATLVTEEFFYDGNELVHTRSSAAGESHYYLIDPNTGDVLFDQKGSTVYTTLTVHLGTVRDLVNSSGQIVNHLVYDAFGNRTSETNPQGGALPVPSLPLLPPRPQVRLASQNHSPASPSGNLVLRPGMYFISSRWPLWPSVPINPPR
jgi:hypothetical protein